MFLRQLGKLPTDFLHTPPSKGEKSLGSAHVKADLSGSRGCPRRVPTISKPTLKREGWSQSCQSSRVSHTQPFTEPLTRGEKNHLGTWREQEFEGTFSGLTSTGNMGNINLSKAPHHLSRWESAKKTGKNPNPITPRQRSKGSTGQERSVLQGWAQPPWWGRTSAPRPPAPAEARIFPGHSTSSQRQGLCPFGWTGRHWKGTNTWVTSFLPLPS